MTCRFVLALIAGFLAWADAPLMAQSRGSRRGDAQAVKNGWLFNLEEGKTQARTSGKPLMVVLRCVP